MHKYEIYKDKGGEYRARFKHNSEVIFSTEGYRRKESAINAIEMMKNMAPDAPVEEFLPDEENELRAKIVRAEVPAADRIVELDHNSKEFLEFKRSMLDLQDAIRGANDLGTLGSNEREVIAEELRGLDLEKRVLRVRPAHIWTIAKSTLLWIVDRAGSAVVGSLALALLAALAKLLGVAL